MKKRKGSFLQRMAAILLSAVLTAGMVSNAAPMAVLADDASSSEKTDFQKLIETMEVIMAALEDFTADNDTTAESIQRIIDAAVADAGITDAFVEVRDFQKTAATAEAEGFRRQSMSGAEPVSIQEAWRER